jgi:hypothetical protein
MHQEGVSFSVDKKLLLNPPKEPYKRFSTHTAQALKKILIYKYIIYCFFIKLIFKYFLQGFVVPVGLKANSLHIRARRPLSRGLDLEADPEGSKTQVSSLRFSAKP